MHLPTPANQTNPCLGPQAWKTLAEEAQQALGVSIASADAAKAGLEASRWAPLPFWVQVLFVASLTAKPVPMLLGSVPQWRGWRPAGGVLDLVAWLGGALPVAPPAYSK